MLLKYITQTSCVSFEDLPRMNVWRKRKEGQWTMPGIFEDIVGRDAWWKNSRRKQLYGNVQQSNGVF